MPKPFFSKTENSKDECFTPKYIIDALGPFDLDPCTSLARKFDTAKNHYCGDAGQDGFESPWDGKVWLNPPYSNWGRWIKKLRDYGNGIALIYSRTDTIAFQNYVFGEDGDAPCDGILFIKGRLRFTGAANDQKNCATAPSVLIAYGSECASKLALVCNDSINGHVTILP